MPYKEGGKWRGAVMVDGQRKTKLFDTRKAARDWEAAERKRLKNFPLTSDGMALNVFCTRYLNYVEARKLSRKTYVEKRTLAKRICDRFGKHSWVGEITVDQIATYLEERAEEVSANTYNRDRKNLLAMWNWGFKRLDLAHNPVAKTDRLPHERKPQIVPTKQEVNLIQMAADRHDRNLIIACATTGGRRSEIFRWTWTDDIDFENERVRLGHRKGRNGKMKYRYMEMNKTLREALKDQWETRLPHSDYVFQNRAIWTDKDGNVFRKHPNYGQRFTARRRFMRGLCKRAGIEPLGFHSLRRFWASEMRRKGVDMLTIQQGMGHKYSSTTDGYIYNLEQDSLKRAVEHVEFEDFLHEDLHVKEKRS